MEGGILEVESSDKYNVFPSGLNTQRTGSTMKQLSNLGGCSKDVYTGCPRDSSASPLRYRSCSSVPDKSIRTQKGLCTSAEDVSARVGIVMRPSLASSPLPDQDGAAPSQRSFSNRDTSPTVLKDSLAVSILPNRRACKYEQNVRNQEAINQFGSCDEDPEFSALHLRFLEESAFRSK